MTLFVSKNHASITTNNNIIVKLHSNINKLSNSLILTLENNRVVVFEKLNLSDNTINNSSNNFYIIYRSRSLLMLIFLQNRFLRLKLFLPRK